MIHWLLVVWLGLISTVAIPEVDKKITIATVWARRLVILTILLSLLWIWEKVNGAV